MESWHLPNLSVQIAPDCISEYLNFQNFPGGACPRTPLVSRDFVAPNGRSRAHIANILNYATPGLTNKKRLGTPLNSHMMYTFKGCSILTSCQSYEPGYVLKLNCFGWLHLHTFFKERLIFELRLNVLKYFAASHFYTKGSHKKGISMCL